MVRTHCSLRLEGSLLERTGQAHGAPRSHRKRSPLFGLHWTQPKQEIRCERQRQSLLLISISNMPVSKNNAQRCTNSKGGNTMYRLSAEIPAELEVLGGQRELQGFLAIKQMDCKGNYGRWGEIWRCPKILQTITPRNQFKFALLQNWLLQEQAAISITARGRKMKGQKRK